MIHIQTIVFDPDGLVTIEENKRTSSFGVGTVRFQRDKLLNGSVYTKHHGFAEGDRTFKVIAKRPLTSAQAVNLWRIFTTYTKVLMSCRDGLYRGYIKALSINKPFVEFTFIPETKYA